MLIEAYMIFKKIFQVDDQDFGASTDKFEATGLEGVPHEKYYE